MERTRTFVAASLLAVGTMLASDISPVRAGGGSCTLDDDPYCEGDWPYGYTYRPGVRTYETDKFAVRTNYPSKYIRIDSKTKFLGFLWPSDDGAKEAKEQIEGERCETLGDMITFHPRDGTAFQAVIVDNPNCQLRFSVFR